MEADDKNPIIVIINPTSDKHVETFHGNDTVEFEHCLKRIIREDMVTPELQTSDYPKSEAENRRVAIEASKRAELSEEIERLGLENFSDNEDLDLYSSEVCF